MILVLIWKTVWWRNIIFGIMDQCDTKIDLVKYMWVSDLYFMVHWFCLISYHTLELFLYFKNWSRPVVFVPLQELALVHDPVILPRTSIAWRLFDAWTSYFGIMSQYDTTFDLQINVGRCDLYFMVQWFCLISWRLFDIWTPYNHFDYESVWPDVWPKNKCRSE